MATNPFTPTLGPLQQSLRVPGDVVWTKDSCNIVSQDEKKFMSSNSLSKENLLVSAFENFSDEEEDNDMDPGFQKSWFFAQHSGPLGNITGNSNRPPQFSSPSGPITVANLNSFSSSHDANGRENKKPMQPNNIQKQQPFHMKSIKSMQTNNTANTANNSKPFGSNPTPAPLAMFAKQHDKRRVAVKRDVSSNRLINCADGKKRAVNLLKSRKFEFGKWRQGGKKQNPRNEPKAPKNAFKAAKGFNTFATGFELNGSNRINTNKPSLSKMLETTQNNNNNHKNSDNKENGVKKASSPQFVFPTPISSKLKATTAGMLSFRPQRLPLQTITQNIKNGVITPQKARDYFVNTNNNNKIAKSNYNNFNMAAMAQAAAATTISPFMCKFLQNANFAGVSPLSFVKIDSGDDETFMNAFEEEFEQENEQMENCELNESIISKTNLLPEFQLSASNTMNDGTRFRKAPNNFEVSNATHDFDKENQKHNLNKNDEGPIESERNNMDQERAASSDSSDEIIERARQSAMQRRKSLGSSVKDTSDALQKQQRRSSDPTSHASRPSIASSNVLTLKLAGIKKYHIFITLNLNKDDNVAIERDCDKLFAVFLDEMLQMCDCRFESKFFQFESEIMQCKMHCQIGLLSQRNFEQRWTRLFVSIANNVVPWWRDSAVVSSYCFSQYIPDENLTQIVH